MLTFSKRVDTLKTSQVMEISGFAQKLKLQGKDVISLAAGEPDFNTPEPMQIAVMDALKKGITRYTPAGGFTQVREALVSYLFKEYELSFQPDEVVITNGAKHAIYLALQCLVKEGDAVLVPTPGWVSYGPMIEVTGATMIPLPLFEEDGFVPNVDRWKGLAIPSSAKGIIINSPNNPSGIVYSRNDLVKLVGWALQRNLWILSDEVYSKILYDGATHISIASLGPEVKEYVVTVNSLSKTCAMTGWRLGWASGPKELISKMTALQSQSTAHVTSFVQWAALEAFKLSPHYFNEMLDAFDTRRIECLKKLVTLSDSLSFVRPNGAFYFFLNLSRYLNTVKMNDVDFCHNFLKEAYVALVPGSAFGMEKFVRLSYATDSEQLKKAFDRLEKFLKQ